MTDDHPKAVESPTAEPTSGVGRSEPAAAWRCASGNPKDIQINNLAFEQMHCPRQLRLIPTSGRGFEDRRALEDIAALTIGWFERHFAPPSALGLGYGG
ncbi:hypothetical protein CNECB9_4820043 [Cupriavidus necator]|uniref:Uncharacterized protein n=1 Tax=Cupriavidus necator TaxID=106590 RepID=A0A1K0IMJ8_CUPNE|nr:hypothetical protein CNECB9_4820043 [Cupriavidus necator]